MVPGNTQQEWNKRNYFTTLNMEWLDHLLWSCRGFNWVIKWQCLFKNTSVWLERWLSISVRIVPTELRSSFAAPTVNCVEQPVTDAPWISSMIFDLCEHSHTCGRLHQHQHTHAWTCLLKSLKKIKCKHLHKQNLKAFCVWDKFPWRKQSRICHATK